jgi:hypothetical protein
MPGVLWLPLKEKQESACLSRWEVLPREMQIYSDQNGQKGPSSATSWNAERSLSASWQRWTEYVFR